MKYKFIGTEKDLHENGFEVFSKDFPYNSGHYPLIGRALRNNIEIFTSIDNPENKNNWIDKEKGVTFAYSHLENMPKEHYIQLNIFYDNYTEKELDTKYAIQDLISKGLIVEYEEAQK